MSITYDDSLEELRTKKIPEWWRREAECFRLKMLKKKTFWRSRYGDEILGNIWIWCWFFSYKVWNINESRRRAERFELISGNSTRPDVRAIQMQTLLFDFQEKSFVLIILWSSFENLSWDKKSSDDAINFRLVFSLNLWASWTSIAWNTKKFLIKKY